MGTFGSLMEGLRVRYLGLTLTAVTPTIDLFLQLLIAVSVTRFINWPVFTIFVFNFAILFSTEFQIYFMPLEDKVEQARTILNALTYLALNYHLFLFTQYVDYEMFPLIANSVIALVWINIGSNLMITISISFLSVFKKCKLNYMRWKYQKSLQKKLS